MLIKEAAEELNLLPEDDDDFKHSAKINNKPFKVISDLHHYLNSHLQW